MSWKISKPFWKLLQICLEK